MGLSTGSPRMYSKEKLERLLRHAKVAQQSIQMVSHWILENRAHLEEMVDVWYNLLLQGDASHQIVYLYIANDAMQVGVRKYGKQIAYAFEAKLLAVVEFIMDSCEEKVKRCLMKIVGIWKERHIVTPALLTMLQNVCAGKQPIEPVVDDEAMAETKNVDVELTKLLQEMTTEASIERVLEDLPEVVESEATAIMAQRLQNLVSATISADLLSDRMFQLESSLSNFHQACEAYDSEKESNKVEPFDEALSGGNIVWEMLESQVFDLDIDKSRGHVQQYRENLEEQSQKREEVLDQLRHLATTDLFADSVFHTLPSTLEEQSRTLEGLYKLCVEAEAIEKQRRAEKQAALNSRPPPYVRTGFSPKGREELYHNAYSPSRSSYNNSNNYRHDYHQNHSSQLQRRHSSSSMDNYYDDQNRYVSKRPRLEHSHSLPPQDDYRWDQKRHSSSTSHPDAYRASYDERDMGRHSNSSSRYSPNLRSYQPPPRRSRWDDKPDDYDRRW